MLAGTALRVLYKYDRYRSSSRSTQNNHNDNGKKEEEDEEDGKEEQETTGSARNVNKLLDAYLILRTAENLLDGIQPLETCPDLAAAIAVLDPDAAPGSFTLALASRQRVDVIEHLVVLGVVVRAVVPTAGMVSGTSDLLPHPVVHFAFVPAAGARHQVHRAVLDDVVAR